MHCFLAKTDGVGVRSNLSTNPKKLQKSKLTQRDEAWNLFSTVHTTAIHSIAWPVHSSFYCMQLLILVAGASISVGRR